VVIKEVDPQRFPYRVGYMVAKGDGNEGPILTRPSISKPMTGPRDRRARCGLEPQLVCPTPIPKADMRRNALHLA